MKKLSKKYNLKLCSTINNLIIILAQTELYQGLVDIRDRIIFNVVETLLVNIVIVTDLIDT